MIQPERGGLTTFVERLENGSEIHQSPGAIEAGVLNNEVTDAIHELGEEYAADERFRSVGEGLGVRVHRRDVLLRMPPLDFELRQRPLNVGAHKVLELFARQAHAGLGPDRRPTYVRVIASGPEATRHNIIPLVWHTDALCLPPVKDYAVMTADAPEKRRWVVGMVVDGEEGESGNTEWLEGELLIPKVTKLEENLHRYEDIFWAGPLDHARTTRDGDSLIRLALQGYEPNKRNVKRYPDGVIGDIGTTTVHRGVLGSHSFRVSLQCYYDQL